MAAGAPNPILDRIAVLADAWTAFAEDEDARVLIWEVAPGGERLVDAFVRTEETDAGVTPDLFLLVDSAFEDAGRFATVLGEAIRVLWSEDAEQLATEGKLAGWSPHGVENVRMLVSLLDSLARVVDRRHVVLVLRPRSVASVAGLQQWICAWVAERPPAAVRLVVLDDDTSPAFTSLPAGRSVLRWRPALDVEDLASDAAAAYGDPGPGKEFNIRFAALLRACGKTDITAVKRAAGAALQVAEAQGWHALSCAVHLATVAAAMRLDDLVAAHEGYRLAEPAANAANAAGDSTGAILLAQIGVGRAGLLLRQERFVEAARVGKEAASTAEAAGQRVLAVEAWRVTTEAWRTAGRPTEAWESGRAGLRVSAGLSPEERANCTLGLLGRSLLATEQALGKPSSRQELDTLLGAGWERRIPG